MKQVVFIAAMIGAMLMSEVSDAQPNMRNRQYNQHQRINNGVRTGQLTKTEAYHLKKQQALIRRDKKIAMADGHISPRERQIINRHQQQANQSIYRAKHNNRCR